MNKHPTHVYIVLCHKFSTFHVFTETYLKKYMKPNMTSDSNIQSSLFKNRLFLYYTAVGGFMLEILYGIFSRHFHKPDLYSEFLLG